MEHGGSISARRSRTSGRADPERSERRRPHGMRRQGERHQNEGNGQLRRRQRPDDARITGPFIDRGNDRRMDWHKILHDEVAAWQASRDRIPAKVTGSSPPTTPRAKRERCYERANAADPPIV